MYKYVVSDLDGTLLNEQHMVDEFTAKVIKKLEDKGIKFAIATGRVYQDAKQIINRAGLNAPIISCNGGAYNDIDGNIIYNRFIDNDVAKIIFDYIINEIIDDKTALHIVKDGIWYQFPNISLERIDTTNDKPIFVEHSNFEIDNINKMFITSDTDYSYKLEKLRSFIEENKLKVSSAYTLKWCFEVFPYQINKLEGLKVFSKKENIELKDIVAFGDGMNDFEMINGVGLGFIMKNGNPKLFEKLPNNKIAVENYNQGVAKKLIELFGIEI